MFNSWECFKDTVAILTTISLYDDQGFSLREFKFHDRFLFPDLICTRVELLADLLRADHEHTAATKPTVKSKRSDARCERDAANGAKVDRDGVDTEGTECTEPWGMTNALGVATAMSIVLVGPRYSNAAERIVSKCSSILYFRSLTSFFLEKCPVWPVSISTSALRVDSSLNRMNKPRGNSVLSIAHNKKHSPGWQRVDSLWRPAKISKLTSTWGLVTNICKYPETRHSWWANQLGVLITATIATSIHRSSCRHLASKRAIIWTNSQVEEEMASSFGITPRLAVDNVSDVSFCLLVTHFFVLKAIGCTLCIPDKKIAKTIEESTLYFHILSPSQPGKEESTMTCKESTCWEFLRCQKRALVNTLQSNGTLKTASMQTRPCMSSACWAVKANCAQ